MIKHAWSLVFFTVLGQLGAGLYIMQKVMSFVGRYSASEIQHGTRRFLLLSLIISILALFISFSHLGHPKNAIFALSNIKTSWLSREVFFLSAFIGIMAMELFFERWLGLASIRENVLSLLAIGIAVAFVFTMVKLYQLETVPSWNSTYTLLHFFNSALLGGAILYVLSDTSMPKSTQLFILIALAAFQILILFVSPSIVNKINYVSLLLYGVVIMLMLLQVLKGFPQQAFLVIKVLCAACFLGGLFVERYQFYAAYRSVGF